MNSRNFIASLVVAGFSIVASTEAFAIPGGGTSKDTMTTKPAAPVKKSPKKLKCKRTETVKRVKRHGKTTYKCVKLKAEVLPDSELYQQARLLADEGEYEWALDHLRLIRVQQNAEVLNYTGYANRKAGRLETGIGYYFQALALNPNYIEAREYLGEAYVLAGLTDLARQQLIEIQQRGGASSKSYLTLAKFIENAPAN